MTGSARRRFRVHDAAGCRSVSAGWPGPGRAAASPVISVAPRCRGLFAGLDHQGPPGEHRSRGAYGELPYVVHPESRQVAHRTSRTTTHSAARGEAVKGRSLQHRVAHLHDQIPPASQAGRDPSGRRRSISPTGGGRRPASSARGRRPILLAARSGGPVAGRCVALTTGPPEPGRDDEGLTRSRRAASPPGRRCVRPARRTPGSICSPRRSTTSTPARTAAGRSAVPAPGRAAAGPRGAG